MPLPRFAHTQPARLTLGGFFFAQNMRANPNHLPGESSGDPFQPFPVMQNTCGDVDNCSGAELAPTVLILAR